MEYNSKAIYVKISLAPEFCGEEAALMEFSIFENRLSITAFQKLRLECGMDLLDRDMLDKALKNSIVTLSAEVSGEVIGMLRIAGDGSYIFVISDVLVRPDYRGNGIGSALVIYSLECVKRHIPEGRMTTVSLFAAEGREKFYRNFGFYDLPNTRLGAGMQAIVKNDRGISR